jgi:two-component system cell cycle sensor histidine kinase/response regulator CckA
VAAETPLDVLLVEDSPTDVLLTEEALVQASCFRLRSSERLGEALRLLSEAHFDVVLLDLGLPDSEGIDTLRRLRDRNTKVAVVVLTGKDDEELALRALHEGAEDYLVKGRADAEQLSRAIRYAVERGRSEESLRESEELFRSAFERTNVATCLTDMDNRFLRVNEAVTQMFGYSREEMLRLSVADITHPDDLADNNVLRNSMLAGEIQFFQEEKRYLHKDGRLLWGLTNVSLVRGRSGEPLYYVGQVQDVTDRKRAEAERDALLYRLQLQIQRMPLVYILFDADFRITDWNPAAERTFGYAREEAVGKQPNDLNPPSFHRDALKIMDRIRAGDMAAHSVNENLTKDGRTITCEWFNTPLLTDDGRFGGLLCLGRDVTQKKALQAEQARLAAAVEASEEQMRLLLESTGEGIYGIDMQGHCTFINRAAAAMIGYAPAEVIGQDMHGLIHHHRPDGSPYPVEHCPIYRAMQTQSGVRVRDEVLWRRDGTSFAAEYSSFSIMKEVESQGAVVTFQDITQVRQLEEQFRQAQKMEAVGQLAGGVAHDFNNLLTIISGYSEILLATLGSSDPMRESVRAISEAGERAASLTRQLLAFSRKTVLEPKVLDLNVIVRETEKFLRRLIGEDILLTAVLDPAINRVKVDPGQVGQVLMNLAVNARDAMPRGGKLTVETRNVELDQEYARLHAEVKSGRYVLLSMADTGTGMTPEVKARIFEPFFTTKGVGKGTGLGLAVVLGIVKQSEGHVQVYSEPDIGTTFKIYFPAVEEQVSAPRGIDAGNGGRGTETVLLVEDEDGVRGLAVLVLQTYGYKVLAASSGKEALRLVEKRSGGVDLLVTDVVMPGMGGPELADALRPRLPQMKVLFSSGYTDDAVVRHGLLQEKVAFIQKPYTPLALVKKVRQVLDEK